MPTDKKRTECLGANICHGINPHEHTPACPAGKKKPLVTRLQERAIDFRAGLPHDAALIEEAIAEIFRLEHLAKKNALPRSGEDL